MSPREFHVMNAELIEDRQTMRYTCPVCRRCLEDGPEGFTMVHQGDQSASHRGGSLVPAQCEVEQDAPARPVLH
jgi:hypothetical protein